MLRARQPLVVTPPPGGSVNTTLGTATLTSSATLTAGNAGDLTKTLGAATLSSSGTLGTFGAVSKTLGAATLSSSGITQIIPTQIYQQIWIYDEVPTSKRKAKKKKKIEAKIEAIEDSLERAGRSAELGFIQIQELEQLKAKLSNEFDVIRAQIRLYAAEERERKEKEELDRQAKAAEEKARAYLNARIAAIEKLREAAEERVTRIARMEAEAFKRKDDEIVAELTKLLNHLMATGVNVPEVSQREMKVKERVKGGRRIGRFSIGSDGQKVLTIEEIKDLID